ncbi:winged helix-turn-helix transcriptional regulator [Pseudoalteromonas ardens]|uniref:HxlR family transcriptional regulator n=1 Tax=Pseudoalteromonas rubra TaxID=43658 RepID=A0A0L0EUI4_9GAMM|nr:helix-turn-helix domain-containing protein [Pseudoalteromonas sp. R96]KNC68137.1 HxlR family transcriptional regulator [Pseudoalteromonas rubra]MDK1313812.1 helix-turn-helix domain-containing protein [Pseudoalteromonas sp. R96]
MAENNALQTEELENNLAGCPMTSVMNVIGGKWKVIILFHLRDNTLRFGALKKRIPKITQKMLTQQLRELEADGLVSREVYAEVPPRVEYTSTGLSDELRPILDMLCEWGQRQQHVAHKKGDT